MALPFKKVKFGVNCLALKNLDTVLAEILRNYTMKKTFSVQFHSFHMVQTRLICNVVDPDLLGSKTFWLGQIRIRSGIIIQILDKIRPLCHKNLEILQICT
jgi:hypothetical protein